MVWKNIRGGGRGLAGTLEGINMVENEKEEKDERMEGA